MRGDQRSRPIESIVAEAHQLAEQGVQELILISQIATNYGLDPTANQSWRTLPGLGGGVLDPVHYAYPTGLTPDVLAAYRECRTWCPTWIFRYRCHPGVLRAMNRPCSNVNEGLLDQIREQLPDAVLRTT